MVDELISCVADRFQSLANINICCNDDDYTGKTIMVFINNCIKAHIYFDNTGIELYLNHTTDLIDYDCFEDVDEFVGLVLYRIIYDD